MQNLTTLEKVKYALSINDTTQDVLLQTLIDQSTDIIQGFCGGRIFGTGTYSEILDFPQGNYAGTDIFLKNYPIQTTEPFTVSYRTGPIGSPVWVAYTNNDYLIYDKSGYIKMVSIFGGSTFIGSGNFQSIKVEYTAGYLIDFNNETNPALHNLPKDLTAIATQIVMANYNNSGQASGLKSESTEGQSVVYTDAKFEDLSVGQQKILSRYMKYSI